MSRKNRPNNGALPTQNRENVKAYCDSRTIELLEFNGGAHLRIDDGGLTIVDTWPATGRYWVMKTTYGGTVTERGGEKGFLPNYREDVFDFLDKLLYAVELSEPQT